MEKKNLKQTIEFNSVRATDYLKNNAAAEFEW